MTIVKHLVIAVAALGLVCASPASAEEKHEGHEHGAGHEHKAEKPHFEAKSFASPKEAWTFIIEKTAEADKLVAAKTIEPVHEIGEQLDDALHTLEEKSDMVTGDSKTKLAAILKQLDKSAEELHHAAEDKDADGTALALGKIKGLIPAVEGLYPAGVLK
jgi:hypothetical protein